MARPLRAAARRLLGYLLPGAALPILAGPAQGLRWIVESGNPLCWTGAFERATQRLLVACLKLVDWFEDIRAVGENDRVLVVEPLGRNVTDLQRHLAFNRLGNVICLQAALSDFQGKARFGFEISTSSARLGVEGVWCGSRLWTPRSKGEAVRRSGW